MKERVMFYIVFVTYFYDVSVSEQKLTDLYIIMTVILGFPSLPHNIIFFVKSNF